jgi:hypothetical protein
VLFFARRASTLALPLLTSAPMLAYFIAHGLFGRVNPNWVAPIYPVLALVGAWAAISVRPSSAWLRWPLNALRFLHVPLGMAVVLAALAIVEMRTVPLTNFFYGWDNFQARISKLAADNGAQWVDVPNYSMNGWLSYYGRMADDPLPVYDPGDSKRYRFMPPMSRELRRAPHLIVHFARGKRLPDIEGATPLGIVTRDDNDGTPLQNFAVYLANG